MDTVSSLWPHRLHVISPSSHATTSQFWSTYPLTVGMATNTAWPKALLGSVGVWEGQAGCVGAQNSAKVETNRPRHRPKLIVVFKRSAHPRFNRREVNWPSWRLRRLTKFCVYCDNVNSPSLKLSWLTLLLYLSVSVVLQCLAMTVSFDSLSQTQ